MNYIITNGELYHHGVKGMKWGVRRKKNNVSTRKAKKPQKVELTPEQRTARAEKRLKITAGAAAATSVLAVIGTVSTLAFNAKRHADSRGLIENSYNIKYALGRVRAGRALARAIYYD